MTPASLQELLRGLIDYAGLFPPVHLDLDSAFQAYLGYRVSPEAWMLGRFLCPEARVSEVVDRLGRTPAEEPLAISALVNPNWSDERSVERSFQSMVSISDRSRGRVAVTVIEVKLPSNRPLAALIETVQAARDGMPDPVPVFFETVAEAHALEALAAALAGKPGLGLKLRCGGVIAESFPEPEVVALALHLCRVGAIPFKGTAGLHHPLRHHHVEPKLSVWMHGFVNVFGGALLAHAHRIEPETIRKVLEEVDPHCFEWRDDRFRWRDYEVDLRTIARLRSELVTSFGSCSFDEPRQDLRALGWLE